MYYEPEPRLRIRGCTLQKAIEKLTPPIKKDRDPGFLQEFLLTYRIFLTPFELLTALKKRYNDPSNGQPASNFTDKSAFQRTVMGTKDRYEV